MHEFTVAQAIVDRASREAQARGSRRVRKLRLRLGQYSTIEPSLLASAFEFARLDTPCEQAELEMLPSDAPDDLIIEQVDIELGGARV